ncbi:MAG: glutamate--tRNA ligase [Thermodesulfobacteriota bacterium]
MTVRTRFAPSPTGHLHIGGARTALFNWLFARRHGGEFILRVEDTDAARSTEEATQAILDGMEWLGLDWDEGPFLQSKRFNIYKEHAERLLKEKKGYRCWCTPEELEERRKQAMAEGRAPRYDRRCSERSDTPDGPSAVRFRVPPGKSIIKDLIKGTVAIEHEEIEDLVILRSDGSPTYNLCVVVDEAEMRITHVIRGDDHLNNTPKQILLYEAFGYPVPEFAHLPMILGSDGKRLSKRHGATSVTAYRDEGFLPHALINYLARLGWSHGDQEIFSMDELIEKFSLDNVGKSSGVFNPEKLLWLNHHYIKEARPEDLIGPLKLFLKEGEADDPRLPAIIKTTQERAKTLVEMAEGSRFYFEEEVTYEEKAGKKFLTPDRVEIFKLIIERLEGLDAFGETEIEAAFQAILDEKELKLGKLAQPVRVALTGGTVSPGIFETLAAMGKEMALRKLKRAVETIEEKAG